MACRSDHPLARRRQVTWADLAEHEYMSVTKDSGNRFLLDMALAENPTRPRWYCEAQHVSTLVSLVEAGMGVAAVPRAALVILSATLVQFGLPLEAVAVVLAVHLERMQARSQDVNKNHVRLYAMNSTICRHHNLVAQLFLTAMARRQFVCAVELHWQILQTRLVQIQQH